MIKKSVLIILGVSIIIILSSFVFSETNSYHKTDREVLGEFTEGEEEVDVIVKLKSESDRVEDISKSLMRFTRAVESRLETKEERYKDYVQMRVSLEELRELESSDKIERVTKSHQIRAFLEQSKSLINSTKTDALQIEGVNLTGTGISVCVIDSGVNFSHPDLIGKNNSCIIDCFNKSAGDSCEENCSLKDDNGHGTHVAGIAAASGALKGTALNATIIAIKVLDASGYGSGKDFDLSKAVDYCVSQNVSVITMSLGTVSLYSSDCSESMSPWTEAIDSAFAKNISVIVSSGNDGDTSAIASPACIANVSPVADSYDANIGGINWVGTCTDSTTYADKIVCHANRNSMVELLAPGAMINSTKSTGGYEERGGTSMSAPMVAGAFAVMHELLNRTSRTKTPAQIEEIFNSTGKPVYDSGSGRTFSRIDVYEALVSLDSITPNVTLTYPGNDTVNVTNNQTFVCNVSDWQLSNLTFYLWNSTSSLVYNETKILTGTVNGTVFNVSNLSREDYKWNCLATDQKNNFAFADSNFSLHIGGVSTTLVSPPDNIFTNQGYNDFSCRSVTNQGVYNLSNATFYLWNSSSSIVYNETKIIYSSDNLSYFNYTFSYEDEYQWNCLSFNNNSDQSWSNDNNSLVYDITAPLVNLTSPSNSSSYTSNSQSITFGYNTTDANSISNCSLVINSVINLTNSSVVSSIASSFTSSFTPGSYNWYVDCRDSANNRNYTESRSFTVSAPAQSPSGSSSPGSSTSGGITPTNNSYSPSYEDTSRGYTKQLNKNDRIIFFDRARNEHTLTITAINQFSANLTIKSDPIYMVLGIGQSAKLNLSSKDYYDLYIKLNQINKSKADITIQTINEKIPGANVSESPLKEEGAQSDDGKVERLGSEIERLKTIIYIIIIVIIIILIFLLIKERFHIQDNAKKEHINFFKQKFEKELKPRDNSKK